MQALVLGHAGEYNMSGSNKRDTVPAQSFSVDFLIEKIASGLLNSFVFGVGFLDTRIFFLIRDCSFSLQTSLARSVCLKCHLRCKDVK